MIGKDASQPFDWCLAPASVICADRIVLCANAVGSLLHVHRGEQSQALGSCTTLLSAFDCSFRNV